MQAARRVPQPTSTSAASDEPYTARAIKGTALLEETRALLRAWRPGESAKAFRLRARIEDPLGKATASRLDDLVRVIFEGRLLTHGEEPARSLRRVLEARGYMVRPWSLRVRESVAQHVLHQLTDLSVLGPPRRGVRTLLPYRPGSLAITWLACELHQRGESDLAVVRHRDFQVWQMQEVDVREALDRLSDLGLWIYQGAGSVVRIAWTFQDWDAVLAVLEGPSID